MGRVKATSWKYARLYFVTFILQVSAHLLEDHSSLPTNDSKNILPHNVPWLEFRNDSKHFGPEVAGILIAPSFSGG